MDWLPFGCEGWQRALRPQGCKFLSLVSCHELALPWELHPPQLSAACAWVCLAGQCNTDLCPAPHSYKPVAAARRCAGPGWEGAPAALGQEPGVPPHLASTAAPSLIQCLSAGLPVWDSPAVGRSPKSSPLA